MKILKFIIVFLLCFLVGCNKKKEVLPAVIVENPPVTQPPAPDTIILQVPLNIPAAEFAPIEVELPIETISVVVTPSLESVYLSQVGVREATGKNDGADVEKYLRSVKLGKGYSWCSAFVKWCLDEAQIPSSINAWSPTAENSKNLIYVNNEQKKEPQTGDVFTLYYANLKRIGHTGFYHKKVNNSIYESVEGNTNAAGSREGDGVYRKYRSLKSTHSISRWE